MTLGTEDADRHGDPRPPRPPPATRSELFTPFQPSIDFSCILKSQTSVFKENRPIREPGYGSYHIARGSESFKTILFNLRMLKHPR